MTSSTLYPISPNSNILQNYSIISPWGWHLYSQDIENFYHHKSALCCPFISCVLCRVSPNGDILKNYSIISHLGYWHLSKSPTLFRFPQFYLYSHVCVSFSVLSFTQCYLRAWGLFRFLNKLYVFCKSGKFSAIIWILLKPHFLLPPFETDIMDFKYSVILPLVPEALLFLVNQSIVCHSNWVIFTVLCSG